MSTRRERDEAGQTTIMIVGLAVILLILTAVVVDASAAYLHRQSMANLADGAALAAANSGIDPNDIYDGDWLDGDRAELDAVRARVAVEQYLVQTDAYHRFPGLEASDVVVEDQHVYVQIASPMELPLTVPGADQTTVVAAQSSAEFGVAG